MTALEMPYVFYRGNEPIRTEKRFRRGTVTVERLAVAFKLRPSSIHLIDDFTDAIEFPDNDGTFSCLQRTDLSGDRYQVEGLVQLETGDVDHTNNHQKTLSTGAFRRFNLPRSAAGLARKRTHQLMSNDEVYWVKVTLTRMESRKIKSSYDDRMQYFNLTEDDCNVDALTNKVREGFSDETLVLVQANGFKIEDNEATRGSMFWRAGARRIYAVSQAMYNEAVNVKRSKTEIFETIEVKLNAIHEEMKDKVLYHNCDEARTWMNSARMFSNVYDKMANAFRCLIYTEIVNPPIAMSGCCKQMLGCKTCVQRWICEHLNCPHCREPSQDNINYYQCFNDVICEL